MAQAAYTHTVLSIRSFFYLSTLFRLIHAIPLVQTNITVDDNGKDPLTGAGISYVGTWVLDGSCDTCEQLTDSWHASTSDTNSLPPTASLQFTGIAIFINCIIAPPPVGSKATTSDLQFFIDGQRQGTFVAPLPPTSVSPRIQTVFSLTGLSNENHSLRIQNGFESGSPALILLDSIIYTSNQPESRIRPNDPFDPTTTTTTSTTRTGTSTTTEKAVTVTTSSPTELPDSVTSIDTNSLTSSPTSPLTAQPPPSESPTSGTSTSSSVALSSTTADDTKTTSTTLSSTLSGTATSNSNSPPASTSNLPMAAASKAPSVSQPVTVMLVVILVLMLGLAVVVFLFYRMKARRRRGHASQNFGFLARLHRSWDGLSWSGTLPGGESQSTQQGRNSEYSNSGSAHSVQSISLGSSNWSNFLRTPPPAFHCLTPPPPSYLERSGSMTERHISDITGAIGAALNAAQAIQYPFPSKVAEVGSTQAA